MTSVTDMHVGDHVEFTYTHENVTFTCSGTFFEVTDDGKVFTYEGTQLNKPYKVLRNEGKVLQPYTGKTYTRSELEEILISHPVGDKYVFQQGGSFTKLSENKWGQVYKTKVDTVFQLSTDRILDIYVK